MKQVVTTLVTVFIMVIFSINNAGAQEQPTVQGDSVNELLQNLGVVSGPDIEIPEEGQATIVNEELRGARWCYTGPCRALGCWEGTRPECYLDANNACNQCYCVTDRVCD
jgi:hypothetical protein